MIKLIPWLLGPEAATEGKSTHLLPRWIFLRALGLIYFSAFYSLLFQIKGLIGPQEFFQQANISRLFQNIFPALSSSGSRPRCFGFLQAIMRSWSCAGSGF